MNIHPIVFLVNDSYHIMVLNTRESLMWIKVGENVYYDDCNGVLRSLCRVHRIIVPMKEMDQAGKYIIYRKKVLDRRSYFPKTHEVEEELFDFRPVRSRCPRCFHLADTHGMVKEPIAAVKAFGNIDFLILNGDIIDSSDKVRFFDAIYKIAYEITKGEIPIVFARGNHDLRGHQAEHLIDYVPHENRRNYYSFRMGHIWGIVLDCGEDKVDEHAAYGNLICCHSVREKQIEFIQSLIEQEEYKAPDIEWRVVITHIPFTMPQPKEFYIEKELYSQWALLLDQYIKPDIMIVGHEHRVEVRYVSDSDDEIIQPCPIIVGAKPGHKHYVGTGMVFGSDQVEVYFVDNKGDVLESARLQKGDRHEKTS